MKLNTKDAEPFSPTDLLHDNMNSKKMDLKFLPIPDFDSLDNLEGTSLAEIIVGASLWDFDEDLPLMIDPISVSSCSSYTRFTDSVDPKNISAGRSLSSRESREVINEKSTQTEKTIFDEMWDIHYKDLLAFVTEMGHANVPHTYPKNKQMARWVKRQRHQYKLRQRGKQSSLTPKRIDLLESAGFVWDSHELTWREKFSELKEFQRKNGHCHVPTNQVNNKLRMWVKSQRRQFKLYQEGKPSAMLPRRIRELEEVGFDWNIRKRKGSLIENNNSPKRTRVKRNKNKP